MDNFSEKIEKALPAKEVNGSPGQHAGFTARSKSDDQTGGIEPRGTGETIDPRYETKSRRRQTASKSRDSGPQASDNPVHAGWVTGGRGIKSVINEERLAYLKEAGPPYTATSPRDPHPNPLPGRERGLIASQNTGQRLEANDRANSSPVAVNATSGYAELHAHSNYSFQEGASEAWDLLLTAKQLGLYALAITDHDNVSGVMEFAQAAKELDIKPIIGIELTLARGRASEWKAATLFCAH